MKKDKKDISFSNKHLAKKLRDVYLSLNSKNDCKLAKELLKERKFEIEKEDNCE